MSALEHYGVAAVTTSYPDPLTARVWQSPQDFEDGLLPAVSIDLREVISVLAEQPNGERAALTLCTRDGRIRLPELPPDDAHFLLTEWERVRRALKG